MTFWRLHDSYCYSWDEWVPESRVLKYNEANVQRQKEVQRAHSAQPAKTKKGIYYHLISYFHLISLCYRF